MPSETSPSVGQPVPENANVMSPGPLTGGMGVDAAIEAQRGGGDPTFDAMRQEYVSAARNVVGEQPAALAATETAPAPEASDAPDTAVDSFGSASAATVPPLETTPAITEAAAPAAPVAPSPETAPEVFSGQQIESSQGPTAGGPAVGPPAAPQA